jgi:hypothetical protein
MVFKTMKKLAICPIFNEIDKVESKIDELVYNFDEVYFIEQSTFPFINTPRGLSNDGTTDILENAGSEIKHIKLGKTTIPESDKLITKIIHQEETDLLYLTAVDEFLSANAFKEIDTLDLDPHWAYLISMWEMFGREKGFRVYGVGDRKFHTTATTMHLPGDFRERLCRYRQDLNWLQNMFFDSLNRPIFIAPDYRFQRKILDCKIFHYRNTRPFVNVVASDVWFRSSANPERYESQFNYVYNAYKRDYQNTIQIPLEQHSEYVVNSKWFKPDDFHEITFQDVQEVLKAKVKL